MLIFNGKTAGNINLAYKAEIDDGLLDVINCQKNITSKYVAASYKYIKRGTLRGLQQRWNFIF